MSVAQHPPKKPYAAPGLTSLGTLPSLTAGPDPVSGGVDALIGQSGGFESVDPS